MKLFSRMLTFSLGILLTVGSTAALMAPKSNAAGWTPELAMKVQ